MACANALACAHIAEIPVSDAMAPSSYIGPNEPGFEGQLENALDKWCNIFWGHKNWQEIRGGGGQVLCSSQLA